MAFLPSTAKLFGGICLWFIFWIASGSSEVAKEGNRNALRSEQAKSACYSQCDSRYQSSKTEPWLACHHGCRLLNLLGQLATGKSRKEVRHSCQSACTESYNVTVQERACHTGCGEQTRDKKKVSSERNASTDGKVVGLAPTTAPKVSSPPSIKYFWSKSVVDEQETDSSDEKARPHRPVLMRDNDPFLDVFNGILPIRFFLPQSFRITKSSVTYVGSDIKNIQSVTKADAPAKEAPRPPASLSSNEGQQEIHLIQNPDVTLGKTLEVPPPKESTSSDHVDINWRPGGTGMGRPEILLVFIGLTFFSAFFLLFRAIMASRNYIPVSTFDTKRDDHAAGHHNGDDDLDSGDEYMGIDARLAMAGLLPPSYEQAQRDLNSKLNRPLQVSLNLSTTGNTTC